MPRADLSDLHARLVAFLVSGGAAATVEGLLGDGAQLADVASRSYAHPNGFRKLVLALPEDGTRMRVHHWPRGDMGPSNVHNHRWAFASAIVAGRLSSALFTIGEKGEAVEKYRFEPSHPGSQYVLSRAGNGHILTTGVAEFGPGSTYALSANQLHQVCAEPNTLSLVISGPPERDHTDVFRPANRRPQSRDLPLLPLQEVRDSLELLTDELRTWAMRDRGRKSRS
jgi:hypothetical protein